MWLLIMHFPPTSSYVLLHTNIHLSALFSPTLNLCSSLKLRDEVSRANKTKPWGYTSKIIRTQSLAGQLLPNLFEEKQENGGCQ
jgi:hypothetical protein